eukprot:Gb_13347 [translate_table: standard]
MKAMASVQYSHAFLSSPKKDENLMWRLHCAYLSSLACHCNQKPMKHLKSRASPALKFRYLTGLNFFPDIQIWSMVSRHLQRCQYCNIQAHQGNEGDVILKSISKTAEVSVLSIAATEVVQEAQLRHKAAPTAAAALGRVLIGTLLLGAVKGDAETVQVTFAGDGPLGQITTIASSGGLVKGFVGNPLCDLPLSANHKLNVGAAVGSGLMSVVRSHSNWPQPYTGSVPIYSGEIAEDFAHYLADSEQMNTAIGIGVTFTREATVQSAHGFLVQVLPFCSEETILKLEENIQNMPSLSDTSVDKSAYSIIDNLFKDIGIGDMYNLGSPKFGPCNREDLKHRMLRAMASLGQSDIKLLLHEQGCIEVKCEFCAEVLCFAEDDLQDIIGSSIT